MLKNNNNGLTIRISKKENPQASLPAITLLISQLDLNSLLPENTQAKEPAPQELSQEKDLGEITLKFLNFLGETVVVPVSFAFSHSDIVNAVLQANTVFEKAQTFYNVVSNTANAFTVGLSSSNVAASSSGFTDNLQVGLIPLENADSTLQGRFSLQERFTENLAELESSLTQGTQGGLIEANIGSIESSTQLENDTSTIFASLSANNTNNIFNATTSSSTNSASSSVFNSADNTPLPSVPNPSESPTVTNSPPSGADKTITLSEDNVYIFTAADFGFSDSDIPANSLLGVILTSLPEAGVLQLNDVDINEIGLSIDVLDIIAGNLKFSPSPDATGTAYASFTFQVQDDGGIGNGSIDIDPTPNTITIDITAINDAPTLEDGKTPELNPIAQDSGAPSGAKGTLVSALVDLNNGSGLDNVSDPDSGALLGVAVTSALTSDGSWFYSTDNGSNWFALGAVSDNSARLLAADANTRLYFQPTAGFTGTIASAITFRAWDRTSGSNGESGVDTTTNGGSTAFSSATDTADITVNIPIALFTTGNDTIDFNALSPYDYILSYDALAGNDVVVLPNTQAEIDAWGYDTDQTFFGGLGSDTIVGGNVDLIINGSDSATIENNFVSNNIFNTISYANVTGNGVNITLSDDSGNPIGTATGRLGSSKTGTDTLFNFYRVIGSDFSDYIIGNPGVAVFIVYGGGGDDTLQADLNINTFYRYDLDIDQGSDTIIDAGGPIDTLDFATFTTTSVNATLDLSTTALQTVVPGILSLTIQNANSIERVDFNTTASGTHFVRGNVATNSFIGGAGNDTFEGLGGNDVLVGGLGNDVYLYDLDTAVGTDLITETNGTINGIDTLDFSNTGSINVIMSLNGTLSNNVSFSTFTNILNNMENVVGGSLNDTLRGNTLANVLDGNSGNDSLDGREGNDTLIGGLGNDTLIGGTGNDSLVGGSGNDIYVFNSSGLGTDTIIELNGTADGIDTLDFTSLGTAVVLNLNAATFFSPFISLSSVSSFAANIENVICGIGNDTITGNAANNTLYGGGGTDNLDGGAGDDILESVGNGTETLTGGSGNDLFKYMALTDVGNGSDTITDFKAGGDADKFVFNSAVFNGNGIGVFFQETTNTSSSDPFIYFLYNNTNGRLFYDGDADGVGVGLLVADTQLSGPGSMVQTDIQFI